MRRAKPEILMHDGQLPMGVTGRHGAFVAALLMLLACASGVQAQSYANLPVIKPVQSCAELGKMDLSHAADRPATIQSATLIETEKGPFCKVLGNIEPSIGYEVDLPVEHWTQRYLEGGCGGLCGMRGVGVTNASSCAPALNGEFVVAGDDMGHEGQMGGPGEAEFARDPQKRIDFAYRGNHETTLVAKALIQAFYGQGPRYSYFMGCSDGGREALMEAQRYPNDFDGISAGDPAALFQVQNSFYHAWSTLADKRADGTNILMPAKLQLVHDAAIAHCDTFSGVQDGLLQDPRTCVFNPASLRCPAESADTSTCLTADEASVVQKLYDGASDGQGHHYTFGAQRGGEAQWGLARSPTGTSMSAGMASRSMEFVILPTVSPADGDVSKFAFTDANFARVSELAPLYDATNTNLKPFAAHGGKLILWHGWSDTSITPGISIAYYQGVQKFVGAAATDKFLRLFLLPGVGHCGGGDGYDQIDLLSPLMAWTELGRAPAQLLAGKSAEPRMGPPGGGPPGGGPGTGGPVAGPRSNIANGAGGPAGGGPPPGAGPGGRSPFASPAPRLLATRPVYPYPFIPHYTGQGDPKDAANYTEAKSPISAPQEFGNESEQLIGPDNQRIYEVKDGKVVVSGGN
jgi:hypothetical protein